MPDFGERMDVICERCYGNDVNKKPRIYLAEYERLFSRMRNAPLSLLELGVKFGASMFLWAEYFPNAIIVGLDVDRKPQHFPREKRVHFVQGSQDDPGALAQCVAAAGGQFDIIIDDASHVGRLSAASFAHLFPRALKPGGFYVVEDICTAFLSEFPDSEPFVPTPIGRQTDVKQFASHTAGMVGFVKQVFDHVMAPVATGDYTEYPIERMLILTNIAIVQKALI
jgi:cephalosporin hydroxylase